MLWTVASKAKVSLEVSGPRRCLPWICLVFFLVGRQASHQAQDQGLAIAVGISNCGTSVTQVTCPGCWMSRLHSWVCPGNTTPVTARSRFSISIREPLTFTCLPPALTCSQPSSRVPPHPLAQAEVVAAQALAAPQASLDIRAAAKLLP
ncbi:hypothetical protein D3C77_320710 [compost metagenome]